MYSIKMSAILICLLFSIELVINQNLDYKLPKLFEDKNLIDLKTVTTSTGPISSTLASTASRTATENKSATATATTKSATSATTKSITSAIISINKKGNKCNNYNYSCELCLAKGCIYCWYERECVNQNHVTKDYINDKEFNQTDKILTEKDARILNNNTILIKSLGTIQKNTCSKLNTLSNISASSCSINELTLLWIIFSTVILSISLLFGLLFYFCVFKSKTRDIIIIESDKDNFILIDED